MSLFERRPAADDTAPADRPASADQPPAGNPRPGGGPADRTVAMTAAARQRSTAPAENRAPAAPARDRETATPAGNREPAAPAGTRGPARGQDGSAGRPFVTDPSRARSLDEPQRPGVNGSRGAATTIGGAPAGAAAAPGAGGRAGDWRQVLLEFVDHPREAVEKADRIVDDAVRALTERINREHSGLRDAWRTHGEPSTEDLRQALRGYRDFFDKVLNSR